MPAWVDADLVVSGSPPPTNEADDHEPTFTIPICCGVCELKAGSESAIRIRLDDGPLRPHLLNECVNTHLSRLFYLLTPHSTGHWHLSTAMEHCMPNSMSGLLKIGSRLYPLPALIIRTLQV